MGGKEAAAPNLEAVRALVDDAEPLPSVRRFQGDPEPGQPRNGDLPGQWRPNALGLPPDCPIVPLGVDGDTMWLLDPIGQLVAYTDPFGQGKTLLLFKGRDNYLKWAWPKWGRPKTRDDGTVVYPVDGWKNEAVRDAVVAACTAKGPWSPVDKLRGRGAWRDDAGGIVLHCGPDLVVDGRRMPPGELDGMVYPTRPPIPRPWPRPVDPAQNPAKLLMPMLRSWNWERPDVDAHLLLGWIGAAFLGAALPWRPVAYITGDAGTGKSKLQELIKLLLGEWLIQTIETTAAGIYQHVGHDCVPIAVDEFEGKSDNRAAVRVLELARQACSGGLMLRGGDRHSGVQFEARSTFIFSSINTPPLKSQDLSRMAILQLNRLKPGVPPPELDKQALGTLGRCILRRLLDQWPRYMYTFKAFRAELQRGGYDARGQDTFGSLLACADLIEFDGWDESRLKTAVDGDMKPWSEVMAASLMAEFEDRTENWRGCLNHMLSVPVDAWRNGTKSTVGQVLETWSAEAGYFDGADDAADQSSDNEFNNDVKKVRNKLAAAGLSLERRKGRDDWLIIPNQNPLTYKLFEGMPWAGEPGASVWSRALRQGPRGTLWEQGQCTVAGVKSRCTLISLRALYGPGGIMRPDPPAPANPTGRHANPDPNMAEK